MFVQDYAQAMKKAAKALRDVDKSVAESELVMNFITNADPRYNTTGEIIASEAGMTFSKAVDRLALQELRLANQTKVAASSTLVASSSGCVALSSAATAAASTAVAAAAGRTAAATPSEEQEVQWRPAAAVGAATSRT